jgi:long-chain fatty acid transport protein
MSKRVFLAFICLFLLVSVRHAMAITDEEVFRNFSFSFQNPGARSTAMGGAFIGLADDATAAVANPAGLTILTKPEVSFEYRNVTFDENQLNAAISLESGGNQFTSVGRNTLEDLNQPSFLSVVIPTGQGTTFGVSRQEAVEVKGNIKGDFVIVFPGQGLAGDLLSDSNTEQKVINYNFSFGSKMGDSFAVGASFIYSHLDWTTTVDNSVQVVLPDGTITDPIPQFQTSLDDSDNAYGFNAGILAKAGPKASVGFVYKHNPKFEVTETSITTSPGAPFAPVAGPFKNVFKIPDSFGGGVALKPMDNLTLTGDVDYIKYEDLTEDFQAGYNIISSGFGLDNSNIKFKVDNQWEYHIGTEFVVLAQNTPLALRAGYYHKPSNSLVVDSTSGVNPDFDTLIKGIFAPRQDENHFTLGSGAVIGQHFQVDFAFDVAKSTTNFVLSTVVRF